MLSRNVPENKLTTLAALCSCVLLETVDVSRNRVRALPEHLQALTSLRRLCMVMRCLHTCTCLLDTPHLL